MELIWSQVVKGLAGLRKTEEVEKKASELAEAAEKDRRAPPQRWRRRRMEGRHEKDVTELANVKAAGLWT